MSAVVRAGYKQTAVGVIPSDWDVVPLEACTSFISYGFTNPMPTAVSGVYMITAKDINFGKIQFDSARCTSEEAYRTMLTAKSRPEEDDLLLTKDGTLGRLALVEETPVCINQSVAILRPNTKIVPGFLKLLLEAPAYQNRMLADAGGSTIKHIYITIVNRMPVVLPPQKSEQRAIATALSDVDALLAKLDALVAKKRDLKVAAMQKLLTGQTRLPGFRGEWEVKHVEEFGEVVTGGTPRTDVKEYWGEGFPWITPTDISIGRDMCSSERSITRLGLNSIRPLPKNTVLVTCIASIGKNAILKVEGGCNQQINAVVPNKDHCAEFLYFLFDTGKKYLQANAGTTATSIISKATFSKLVFTVPLLPEQTAIATVLSDMDTELTALEARRDKTRAIKQGMMQELLTGRIRLVANGDL
jgi:type I restriction enzyme, S subunit